MDSVRVVIVDVFAQQPMQVPFVHDDQVVEKLPASVADPSFRNPILPWGVVVDQATTSKRPFA